MKPAVLWHRYKVDWKPTLNLGKKNYSKEPNLQAAAARADRVKDRDQARQLLLEQRQREHEQAAKRRKLNESGEQVSKIDFAASSGEEILESESMNSEIPDFQVQEPLEKEATTQTEGPEQNEAGSQTEEFDYMFRPAEYQAPDHEFFESDAKVRSYAGLPSYEVLMVVFEHVASHVSRQTQNLSRFREFVMVLIKLRLNVPLQDLAYRFVVSVTTVSRIFSYWIVVMDVRLKFMISWPVREQLWQTMPMCFQYAFGKEVVVIDCFEVFIERPSYLLARAQTFSLYKHHNTFKVLVGITPQGRISFVSEAWGGRTSDKYLTENCGFLEFLVPGDMVMADRGLTISDSVGLKQAKLTIPAFTKRKSQLDLLDVEQTRGIANVHIHVERVISLLRRKYAILQSTLPTDDYLTCNRNGLPETEVPTIDRIIRICPALVNFCPPIVPFN